MTKFGSLSAEGVFYCKIHQRFWGTKQSKIQLKIGLENENCVLSCVFRPKLTVFGPTFKPLTQVLRKDFVSLISWKNEKKKLGGRKRAPNLAHRHRSDFCDFCDCDAHRGPQKSQRFPRQDKAILHCDLRVRWKVASGLRFRAAISEPETPSVCGISGDLAPSTRKSLAIAIVRFWCAKEKGAKQIQNLVA